VGEHSREMGEGWGRENLRMRSEMGRSEKRGEDGKIIQADNPIQSGGRNSPGRHHQRIVIQHYCLRQDSTVVQSTSSPDPSSFTAE